MKKFSVVEKEEDERKNSTSSLSKQLLGNIRVSRARTIGPRNKQKTKKKVRFALANTLTQDRVKRIKKDTEI